jgi:hypothetical protein
MLTTKFDLEAYNTIEKALVELKSKTNYPYARMVGYLMCNVTLTDAQRIANLISEMESEK